ncbi:hypothetical protein GW915_05920 [bacterium]|nr:hypothetical protein [bacterium]
MSLKLKVMRILFTLITAVLLSACVKPVVRQDPQLAGTSNKAVIAQKEKRKFATPDLNKRLWILPFTKSYATNEEIERYHVPAILQVELFGETGRATNPFILPTSDQRTLKAIGIDSSTDHEELVKIAQGATVAGFLKGDVLSVEVVEEEEAEGVLRTRKVMLKVRVRYELYDAVSGRKVHEGEVEDYFAETRSDVMRLTNKLSQPRKKIGLVANKIAKKIMYELIPYSGKLGWQGKILKIESNRIFINSGRTTGIRLGDVLKVLERSRDIYDPDSGMPVGAAPGRLKGTIKVIQYFGLDGSIAILQSGGGVFPGDQVELY